ncbi:MAG: type IV-A pilus assembly ATPase PilB, partial [Acinetobacter sp.]|nr:type IV-A pilus assembly ATPase PilB [Acinetobacter sp.]
MTSQLSSQFSSQSSSSPSSQTSHSPTRQQATGFMQRLIAQNELTSEQLQLALQAAQHHKLPIVAVLIQQFHIKPLHIAHAIAEDLGEPLLDLASFDLSFVPKDALDEKIIHQYHILPLYQRGKTLFIATSNPADISHISHAVFHQRHIQCVVVEHHKLEQAIHQLFSHQFSHQHLQDLVADDLHLDVQVHHAIHHDDDVLSEAESAPVVQYVNKLLLDAIRMGASDLHFEPYERFYRVRYRIDGILRQIATPPLQLATRLASRIKIMSQMDIAEKRLPQDGRLKLTLPSQQSIDFRVSSLPTLYGEKLVLRILNSSFSSLNIDDLGLEADQKALYLDALKKPHGMILITGPTGSGKTLSLYAGLNLLNTQQLNISTVEDPVEIYMEGINQVNVNTKAGLTFATALRSFLRQDPDILMVGEIRDVETAEIAIKASQTGHKVLSTLHTNSATETLTRLKNMGIASFHIATSVQLVIAQRLVRRLCPHCKKALQLPHESLKQLGFSEQQLAQPQTQIYDAVGCHHCHDGYKGRIGIYE